MFNIQELDDLVYSQLDRYDLTQCVRVNKKWHTLIIPYLWRDTTALNRWKQIVAFRQMVLEDYLHEQQQHQRTAQEREEKVDSGAVSLTLLEKNARWIQRISPPKHILKYLQGWMYNFDINAPTSMSLFRHFLKRCTSITFLSLELEQEELESDEILKVIVDYYLPHTRDLYINTFHLGFCMESWLLKHLLSRCSSRLEKLTLWVVVVGTEERKIKWEGDHEENVEPEWLLKDLKLRFCIDKSNSKTFWPWLWKHCSRVKTLKADYIFDLVHSLAEGISTHMTDLTEIELGNGTWDRNLKDQEVAELLSSSYRGWKTVRLKHALECMLATKAALTQHFSTLEELVIDDGHNGFTRDDLITVLSSCPKLRMLIFSEDFAATTFIDRNPDTGSLREWACEGSLKVLQVKITEVPRPDIISTEDYPGQGRGIQRQVYERLARLTKLEMLVLGHHSHSVHWHSSLEISLDSGLYWLEGLKELKALDLSCLEARIGVEEIEWMSKHWPKLDSIKGLSKEVINSVQGQFPAIQLQ
ncbi:hypothetical protein BGZ65_007783 [Modicella reniformis]|uniref:F-box domain-containing protein n=1 Tax=Modicella reniformis TaxID=1440133 RepID=A0A9P6IUS6_9FUNG|nr:hypothetical protein BGZ65_007783 [Modicella reniformis]